MSLDSTKATEGDAPGGNPDSLRRWADLSRKSEQPQTALRFEEAAEKIERLRKYETFVNRNADIRAEFGNQDD